MGLHFIKLSSIHFPWESFIVAKKAGIAAELLVFPGMYKICLRFLTHQLASKSWELLQRRKSSIRCLTRLLFLERLTWEFFRRSSTTKQLQKRLSFDSSSISYLFYYTRCCNVAPRPITGHKTSFWLAFFRFMMVCEGTSCDGCFGFSHMHKMVKIVWPWLLHDFIGPPILLSRTCVVPLLIGLSLDLFGRWCLDKIWTLVVFW